MIDAATVGAPDTVVGLVFARWTLHLTLFPIVAIRCASVAAVLPFHRPRAQNFRFIL
jgi:hypothetical protein